MTENQKRKWKDKRYIGLARQSDDKEGNASTIGQLAHLRRECAAVGMSETDVIALDGVTGSMPGRRSDMQALLRRKRERDDFDVIAVHVVDRLTRGGTKHGFWFEHECAMLGLEVFFVGEDIPSGPYSSVVRASMYEAAHEASVSTGRRSTDGQTNAIRNGGFRTAGQTPIGCDRLYCDVSDDRQKFVIRDLVDGRQEQLHLTTREVIGRYGSIGKKSKNRFRKQRNEYSLLIPDGIDGQRTVRLIFFLRYAWGWRGQRIADLLNRHGRPAPQGGAWSQRQVESVYENECYTGLDVKGRVYSGRFYRRDAKCGYVWLDRSETELATATHFQPVLLPRSEWIEDDQPHMVDFLPRHVRDLAIYAQAQMWEQRLDPTRPRRAYTAHPASDYLLSNLLVDNVHFEPLVGTLSGPKGQKTQYYRHKRAKRKKLKGSVWNNVLRCDALHEGLLNVVREVALDTGDLRERLIALATERGNDQDDAGNERRGPAELEAERREIASQIELICQCLSGAALVDAKPRLQQLGRRRNEIEAELKRLARERDGECDLQVTPEVLADRVIAELRTSVLNLQKAAPEAVRNLIHEIVASATVDMATKAVAFELIVPERLLERANVMSQLCLLPSTRSSTGGQTQRPILAVAECKYRRVRGSHTEQPCYECRRAA